MNDVQIQMGPQAGLDAEQLQREWRRITWSLALAGVVFLLFLGYRIATRVERTYAAEVETRGVPIAARVAGRVREVLVNDGEKVVVGQRLVALEAGQLEIKLALADAQRATATESVRAARAQLVAAERSARATLAQARGGVLSAQSGLLAANAADKQRDDTLRQASARRERLEDEYAAAYHGSIVDAGSPEANYVRARTTYDAAQALLAAQAAEVAAAGGRAESTARRSAAWGSIVSARGRLDQAKAADAQLEAVRANVALAESQLGQAETQVKLARAELDDAVIRAPVAGTIRQLAAQNGGVAPLYQPLMTIETSDERWVVARYAGDQVRALRDGQRADVTIAALRARPFGAKVERIGRDGKVVLKLDDDAEARAVQPAMEASVSVIVKD